MLNHQDIAAQRWYAVEDDMSALGGWCVMNVEKTPVSSDPATGEIQIARYLSEDAAQLIADQHNAGLAGQPWLRPSRYRVRAEDALIFDRLGETINQAEFLLREAEQIPAAHPLSEIRAHRAVLAEILEALNLLTEGAIRLRSETPGEESA